MGKTATNLSIVLGLITIAFAGYYVYTQNSSTTLSVDTNVQSMENMLNNTRVFIERRQVLGQVKLDVSFFEDERFRSLRSFTRPIEERPIGRPDPFAEPSVGSGVTSF